jgi:hypothetical protein
VYKKITKFKLFQKEEEGEKKKKTNFRCPIGDFLSGMVN